MNITKHELPVSGNIVRQMYKDTENVSEQFVHHIADFVMSQNLNIPLQTAFFLRDLSNELGPYLSKIVSRFDQIDDLEPVTDIYGFTRQRVTVRDNRMSWKFLVEIVPIITHVVSLSKFRRFWCTILRKLGIEPKVNIVQSLAIEVRVWDSAISYYSIPVFDRILRHSLPYVYGDASEFIGVDKDLVKKSKTYRERILINERLNLLCEELNGPN